MKEGIKYHVLIISILLILALLIGSVPIPSNAQETSQTQSKRVMFRDDDVTPWEMDALKAVNQVHIDEGVPVTLGVIPARSFPAQAKISNSLFDSSFAKYMRALVSSNLFELAQHGYNHSDNSKRFGVPELSEFKGMPYGEQYALIKDGRSLMQRAFGAAPTTFIPPFNTGDENTLKAVSELGFTVYSSSTDEFIFKNDQNLTIEPMQLTFSVDKASENSTFENLVNQTESLLNDQSVNDIVVVYHNQAFRVDGNHNADPAKVDVLRHYIQYLKTRNVTFTTLDGRVRSLGLVASPFNVTQTVTQPIMLQRAGTEWMWAVLALAAPLLTVAILRGLTKQIK